jgi:hypothetical protein
MVVLSYFKLLRTNKKRVEGILYEKTIWEHWNTISAKLGNAAAYLH